MRTQTVLLAAVAALACLGFTQAIKCYSCAYGSAGNPAPGITNDPKCADSFDDSLTSLTGANTTMGDWSGYVIFDPDALSQQPKNGNAVQSLTKLFKMPKSKSTGVNAGPYKVYCVKASGEDTAFGTVVMRGFIAGEGVSVGCEDPEGGGRICVCDSDECNSASGLQLSFGLIAAVAFIGKLLC